ncbi:MAG: hypothetical protein IPF44_01925 [Betaproteobacteria bacterium]|nr:hypothetical protein [Betaproteobacteria bacterium]
MNRQRSWQTCLTQIRDQYSLDGHRHPVSDDVANQISQIERLVFLLRGYATLSARQSQQLVDQAASAVNACRYLTQA